MSNMLNLQVMAPETKAQLLAEVQKTFEGASIVAKQKECSEEQRGALATLTEMLGVGPKATALMEGGNSEETVISFKELLDEDGEYVKKVDTILKNIDRWAKWHEDDDTNDMPEELTVVLGDWTAALSYFEGQIDDLPSVNWLDEQSPEEDWPNVVDTTFELESSSWGETEHEQLMTTFKKTFMDEILKKMDRKPESLKNMAKAYLFIRALELASYCQVEDAPSITVEDVNNTSIATTIEQNYFNKSVLKHDKTMTFEAQIEELVLKALIRRIAGIDMFEELKTVDELKDQLKTSAVTLRKNAHKAYQQLLPDLNETDKKTLFLDYACDGGDLVDEQNVDQSIKAFIDSTQDLDKLAYLYHQMVSDASKCQK